MCSYVCRLAPPPALSSANCTLARTQHAQWRVRWLETDLCPVRRFVVDHRWSMDFGFRFSNDDCVAMELMDRIRTLGLPDKVCDALSSATTGMWSYLTAGFDDCSWEWDGWEGIGRNDSQVMWERVKALNKSFGTSNLVILDRIYRSIIILGYGLLWLLWGESYHWNFSLDYTFSVYFLKSMPNALWESNNKMI